VEIQVDNGPFVAAKGTTSWSYSLNTASYAAGAHTITARATDCAGLTTVAVQNVAFVAPPPPPIPELATWEATMKGEGTLRCNRDEINAAIGPDGVVTEANVWYYDGARVYEQIARYTGNNDPDNPDWDWYLCAGYSNDAYRGWVLAVTDGVNWPVGALSGWRVFPHGLLRDYRLTGNPDSREAVRRLAHYSAWADAGGGESCDVSRETAFILQAYLAQEDIGEPRNPLLATAVNYAIGHLDGWFLTKSCTYMQPFMVGLTMAALIEYWERTADPRIPSKIEMAADALWNRAWVSSAEGFFYDTLPPRRAEPGLNMLIAPAYAWLWQLTGTQRHLDRGDAAFAGGARTPNIFSGKQVSQTYRWSFDFVKWRSQPWGSIQPLVGF
jgi:hypothetical protein